MHRTCFSLGKSCFLLVGERKLDFEFEVTIHNTTAEENLVFAAEGDWIAIIVPAS